MTTSGVRIRPVLWRPAREGVDIHAEARTPRARAGMERVVSPAARAALLGELCALVTAYDRRFVHPCLGGRAHVLAPDPLTEDTWRELWIDAGLGLAAWEGEGEVVVTAEDPTAELVKAYMPAWARRVESALARRLLPRPTETDVELLLAHFLEQARAATPAARAS